MKLTSRGLNGSWSETTPCDRRDKRRRMGSAGTGRDMKLVVDMDMEVEDIRSLTRGLWRVRREAWTGRQ